VPYLQRKGRKKPSQISHELIEYCARKEESKRKKRREIREKRTRRLRKKSNVDDSIQYSEHRGENGLGIIDSTK